MGLAPLHFWMPLAYPASPTPAAAVLSGVAVKAGVIGLIRFMPHGAAMPDWGGALAVIGLASAFLAVAVGITQRNPKAVLAYSSISQMGVLATVFAMGLANGDPGVALLAAFYASHHILVKGGLFLAIGVTTATGGRSLWPIMLTAALLSLSLGGLPLSGGALAKLAVKDPLGTGVVGLLATLSSTTTTLLMLHFMRRLLAISPADASALAPARLRSIYLATAFAALIVPWIVYVSFWHSPWSEMLALEMLWSASWPMLIGLALALPLWRWGDRIQPLPEGDIVVLWERVAAAIGARASMFDRWDNTLRQWPVAGVALLALVVVLGGAMLLTARGGLR
jgi:formate hydrogenlyase subunit 3/multisubunit Na+/H+ antiporter MnhD subunit